MKETYHIKFQMNNGQVVEFIKRDTEYSHLVNEITNGDGWFGEKGRLVNLRNVNTVEIVSEKELKETEKLLMDAWKF
jgi:hypothetical protein